MEKDSTIWQYLGWVGQKLLPGTDQSEISTEGSTGSTNPLRSMRRSRSPFEIEEKMTFNPIRVDKKRRYDFNQKVNTLAQSTVVEQSKPEREDLYLFCSNFNKKVKISETTYKRKIIPLAPIS